MKRGGWGDASGTGDRGELRGVVGKRSGSNVVGVGMGAVTPETRLAPGLVVVFANDSLVSFEVKQ